MLAIATRSRRSYSDCRKMIGIAEQFWKAVSAIPGSGLRSWRWNRNRSEVIMISTRWSWSQEEDCNRGAIRKNSIQDLRVWITILVMKLRPQWHCTYCGVVISITAKIERSQRNDRNHRKMIAITKTDSLYFRSMILKAMQLIGWWDFEK